LRTYETKFQIPSCKNAWLEWRFYSCLTGRKLNPKIQGNKR
jgi:hypothetical protein